MVEPGGAGAGCCRLSTNGVRVSASSPTTRPLDTPHASALFPLPLTLPRPRFYFPSPPFFLILKLSFHPLGVPARWICCDGILFLMQELIYGEKLQGKISRLNIENPIFTPTISVSSGFRRGLGWFLICVTYVEDFQVYQHPGVSELLQSTFINLLDKRKLSSTSRQEYYTSSEFFPDFMHTFLHEGSQFYQRENTFNTKF